MAGIVINYRASLESQCCEIGATILEYFSLDDKTLWDYGIDPVVRAYAIIKTQKGEIQAFVCVGVPGNNANWQRDLPYGGLMLLLYERLTAKDKGNLDLNAPKKKQRIVATLGPPKGTVTVLGPE